ncbi:glycosyltransferase [Enterovirga sp. CN4-39]|uniref:glycosyltransferase n=1 Tax=Enterovirga sp. CN4-39 TaxID=3400910 RepID=UPI003C103482
MAHGHPERFPGGGEIAAYRLFSALKGVEGCTTMFAAAAPVDFVRQSGEVEFFEGRSDEVSIKTKMSDYFSLDARSAVQAKAISLVIKAFDPDIVHFHHYMQFGADVFRRCREDAPRAKILLTLHEFMALCHHNGQMVTRPDFSLCTRPDPHACANCFPEHSPLAFAGRAGYLLESLAPVHRLIAPSRFLMERYVSWGIEPGRITQVDNLPPVFASGPPPPRRLATGEGRRKFGFFGQVTPYKGLLRLLKALLSAQESETRIRFPAEVSIHAANLTLNTPELQSAVAAAVARANGRARLRGSYGADELPELMADVDWVIVPSIWWENSPLVIEEALALGRPVICSGIGGMAEKVRPGIDGLHFPVGDHVALGRLIADLAIDVSVWDRIRATMRRPRPDRHSLRPHLDLYKEVLREHRT